MYLSSAKHAYQDSLHNSIISISSLNKALIVRALVSLRLAAPYQRQAATSSFLLGLLLLFEKRWQYVWQIVALWFRPAKSHGISVSLQKSLLISRSHGNITKPHGIWAI